MKIYLAGPMRGIPDKNRPAFREAATRLRVMGHEVFNPGEEEESDMPIRDILNADTDWLCRNADAVALLPGWEASLGAKMEKALAEAIGIEVLYL